MSIKKKNNDSTASSTLLLLIKLKEAKPGAAIVNYIRQLFADRTFVLDSSKFVCQEWSCNAQHVNMYIYIQCFDRILSFCCFLRNKQPQCFVSKRKIKINKNMYALTHWWTYDYYFPQKKNVRLLADRIKTLYLCDIIYWSIILINHVSKICRHWSMEHLCHICRIWCSLYKIGMLQVTYYIHIKI